MSEGVGHLGRVVLGLPLARALALTRGVPIPNPNPNLGHLLAVQAAPAHV